MLQFLNYIFAPQTKLAKTNLAASQLWIALKDT
jgi:hypothetical protein